MPDWQPVAVPDFCPTCGVYWECEHGIITSTIEIPPGPTRRLSPEEFAKLDTGEFKPEDAFTELSKLAEDWVKVRDAS